MIWSEIDGILLGVTLGIILLLQLLKSRLPAELLIKADDSQIMFSISRSKGLWLIPGIGLYVWAMDFFILNGALELRLVSTLLIEATFFSALIITNLVNQTLGKWLAAAGVVSFIGSVVYFA